MELIFIDKTIICQDCGKPFIWKADDQRFYASKKLMPVKRCPACRAIRKATISHQDGGGNG